MAFVHQFAAGYVPQWNHLPQPWQAPTKPCEHRFGGSVCATRCAATEKYCIAHRCGQCGGDKPSDCRLCTTCYAAAGGDRDADAFKSWGLDPPAVHPIPNYSHLGPPRTSLRPSSPGIVKQDAWPSPEPAPPAASTAAAAVAAAALAAAALGHRTRRAGSLPDPAILRSPPPADRAMPRTPPARTPSGRTVRPLMSPLSPSDDPRRVTPVREPPGDGMSRGSSATSFTSAGTGSSQSSARTDPAAELQLKAQVRTTREWIDRSNRPNAPPASAKPGVRELVEFGNMDFTATNYARALQSYNAATKKPSGKCAEVFDNIAVAHLLRQSHDRCVAAATAALQLNAHFAPAYVHRARAARALGRHDDARADFTKAAQLLPEHAAAIGLELQLRLEEQPESTRRGEGVNGLSIHVPTVAAATKPGHFSPKGGVPKTPSEPAVPRRSSETTDPDLHRGSVLQSEQERRQAAQQESLREAERRQQEERRRVTNRKIDFDVDWQARSNKPNKIPPSCSDAVRALVDQGSVDLIEGHYGSALRYYHEALHAETGRCKELLDNCAIACLLSFDDRECVQYATQSLQLDPEYLPAYLHRARAHRCMLQFEAALLDLNAALQLGTPQRPEISREISLLELDQTDRANNPKALPNYIRVLGVSKAMEPDEIEGAYRALKSKWHATKWAQAGEQGRQHAERQLRLAKEAKCVLLDAAHRAQWLEAFREKERVRRLPHARFFCPYERPAPAKTPKRPGSDDEARRPETERGGLEQQRQQMLEKERLRRQAMEEERRKEEEKRLQEEWKHVTIRKLLIDEDWQARSNRPCKSLPQAADVTRTLAEQGAAELSEGNHQPALYYFQQALQYEQGRSRELLDNCAIVSLLTSENEECIKYASMSLMVDPRYVQAYLHRARAFRCLLHFEAALADLNAALELNTPHSPDISREIKLVELDQMDRANNPTTVPNYIEILGVSKKLDKEEIAGTYRALAMKWHPDKWARHADKSEVQHAAQQFQRVNEAHAVLSDDEKRAEWLESFKEQERIRRPPHARFFCPYEKAAAHKPSVEEIERMAEELQRQEEERLATEQQRQRLLESERVRRQAMEEERRKEEDKKMQEEWKHVTLRKIDIDVDWQGRSNRPCKLPPVPPEVQLLVDQAGALMAEHEHGSALSYYTAALQHEAGRCKEVLANCAIACLLSFQDRECIRYASLSLGHDAKFLPPYLHRARAHRCLLQFDSALADLNAALELGTPHNPDISREIRLVQLDQMDRANNTRVVPNHVQVLGVSKALDRDEIAGTYRALAMKWHPDKWARHADKSEVQHAARQFQVVSEAYSALSDDEQRAEWLEAFKEQESIRRPPHARFFCPYEKDKAVKQGFSSEELQRMTEEYRRQEEERLRLEKHQKEVLNQQRRERQKVEEDRQRKENRALEENALGLLKRKLDLDIDWQERSNRPNKTPAACSEEVQAVADTVSTAFAERRLASAMYHSAEILKMETGYCKEMLDNCAVLALLDGKNDACITFATQALAIDSTFLPAYLHRGRARRCLLQLDAALADLNSALELGTAHSPDITREIYLVTVEQKDRAQCGESPRNHCLVLGVSYPIDPDEVAAAYTKKIVDWHRYHPREADGKTPTAAAAEEVVCIMEAKSVLGDAGARAKWLADFQHKERIRHLPHVRFLPQTNPRSATSPRQKRGFLSPLCCRRMMPVRSKSKSEHLSAEHWTPAQPEFFSPVRDRVQS